MGISECTAGDDTLIGASTTIRDGTSTPIAKHSTSVSSTSTATPFTNFSGTSGTFTATPSNTFGSTSTATVSNTLTTVSPLLIDSESSAYNPQTQNVPLQCKNIQNDIIQIYN